jgi:anaerobic magnesium-protoporphyrin IX monomethyl ester cyclase
MAKILLIQPSSIRNRKETEKDASIPLGLIYIGSALEKANHEVKILDRDLHPSNEYLKQLLDKGYDFVGLGVFTNPMLYDAIDVSKFVKENSKAIVLWGGFHVMSLPEITLKNPYVDHIIRGEGEETIVKIVELYDKKKSFSKLKGVDLNPLACPPNLENVPIPNYNLVELENYADFPVSTSRGCPYKCSFCYNSYGLESMKPYRNLEFQKSIELIRDIAYKYKRKTFTIVDDNFPSDRERMKKICDEIAGLDIRFNAFCRANYANPEILSYMKKSGCWQVDIGVESGSQRILNLLNKATTVEMNKQAIKNCKKVGIMSNCLLMLGMPTETREEMKMTERFIKETKPDFGGVSIFYLLPRTKLFDECKKKGMISEPTTIEGWADLYPINFCEPKTNFSELSNEELVEYRKKLLSLLNQGRYLKKTWLYIKNRRLPSYERILEVLKAKLRGEMVASFNSN